jgi:hypothetical protein
MAGRRRNWGGAGQVSLGQMAQYLNSLVDRGNMNLAAGVVVPPLVQQGAKQVEERYDQMGSDVDQSSMSSMIAMAGKLVGEARPAKPPHTPGETYRRLAEHVTVRFGGTGKGPSRTVFSAAMGIFPGGHAPDPSPKWPRGTPLEVVDGGLNRPAWTMSYRETKRSVAYSIMVREMRAGPGSSSRYQGRPRGGRLPDGPASGGRIIITQMGGKMVWRDEAWPVTVGGIFALEQEGKGVIGNLSRIAAARSGIRGRAIRGAKPTGVRLMRR